MVSFTPLKAITDICNQVTQRNQDWRDGIWPCRSTDILCIISPE